MNLPGDRKYTKNFLWFKEENGLYKVDVVKSAAETAEKFLFIEIPEEGTEIKGEEPIAEYEAMKRVGELQPPGKVEVETKNENVEENPDMILEKPYRTWLAKLKPLENFEDKFLSVKEAEKYYEEKM